MTRFTGPQRPNESALGPKTGHARRPTIASMSLTHIFRAGSHTATNGETRTYTEADIAAMAAVYRPELHEAPLVVGHPALDAPAYGWVARLVASGADLYAEVTQTAPEFAEAWTKRLYQKLSAAFYPPGHPSHPAPESGAYYLRHIGALGAQPPAVKGLRSAQFADPDAAGLLQVEFSETTTAPQGVPAVTPEQIAALKTEKEALQRELAAAHNALAAAAVAGNTATHAAYAENLAVEMRIPADKVGFVTALLDHAEPARLPGAAQAAQTVEYGEGDARKPLADHLREFLSGLPAMSAPGATATSASAKKGEVAAASDVTYAEGTPAALIEQDLGIRALAAEQNLSYAEAAFAFASGRRAGKA